MSAATTTRSAKRQLSPDAKGVFVTMTPERLQRLDDDRTKLGLSRGGLLAKVYDVFGDDLVAGLVAQVEADAAVAESVQPLVDALAALSAAYSERAQQRQRIGVHTNQMAKFANVLRRAVERGEVIDEKLIDALGGALEHVDRKLADLAAAEREDDALRAAVRELVERTRAP